MQFTIARRQVLIAMACSWLSMTGIATAQNGSLFNRPASQQVYVSARANNAQQFNDPPAMANQMNPSMAPGGMPPYDNSMNMNGSVPFLDNSGIGLQSSFTFMPPTPARSLKIHDIVSIRVEETAQTIATGNATSRKNTSYDAVLTDWVKLVGLKSIKPDAQAEGDPRVKGTQTEVYRGDSTLRSSESLTFNISAEIADILPNGNLVLSARETVITNDNTWEASLSGVCRPQDINPDNVILSRNIHELKIAKNERGHVRDGYSRGWFTKWLARVKPF